MLKRFRFSVPVEVRFSDIDAMGHVNNAAYLTYLESARIAYWLKVTRRSGLRALDMILARVEIDYRSPVAFGERLAVRARVASMKRSSFVMEFEILERRTKRLVAQARKVLVHYDYARRRSTPLPGQLRRSIRAQDPGAEELG